MRSCRTSYFHGSKRGDDKFGRILRQAFITSCVIGTLNVSMSNIIVSQGASKTSASAMIIGSIVNVALDPLFIYTFNWGVEGAAWATILSRIITTAIYIRFLTKAEVKVSLVLFAPTKRIYADIIKIGISMLFCNYSRPFPSVCCRKPLWNMGQRLLRLWVSSWKSSHWEQTWSSDL